MTLLNLPRAVGRYSKDEKKQLLANLDLEVAHRTRQFEAWLADSLENLALYQESQMSRIPKQVRSMSMREFDKYAGNIQEALRGVQKDRLAAAGSDPSYQDVDRSMRKRKWFASQEGDADALTSGQPSNDDSLRATKAARKAPVSPKKIPLSSTDPSTAQRSRLTAAQTIKRTKSNIIIRRDPSMSIHPSAHSRTTSQSSMHISSQESSAAQSKNLSHSLVPTLQQFSSFRFPHSLIGSSDSPIVAPFTTPKPGLRHTRSFSAKMAIPTKDGHLLEFDPLQTSPGTLEALEGISDSAKKQARIEIGRLVQAAVDKWKIG